MTEQEYADGLAQARLDVKAYVNDPDPLRSARAIQILISAMIGNAGSLENLTTIKTLLQSVLG